jgi:hypothetical protein
VDINAHYELITNKKARGVRARPIILYWNIYCLVQNFSMAVIPGIYSKSPVKMNFIIYNILFVN